MPPAIHRAMNPFEWAILILLAVLWGGSYFYNAVALTALPPFTIVAFRVALGAALLYGVLKLAGQAMPTDRRSWADFLIMGVINNVIPFSLIAWGQSHLESGLAAILNATTPLFGVVLANFFTADEHMTSARFAGVVIGFTGVVVMIGPDAFAEAGHHVVAELACLLAAFFYACSGVFGRRFSRRGIPPLATATGQITASAVVLVPLALIFDQPWTLPAPGIEVWGSLIGLAAISSAFAYVLFYRILATAGAVNLMLVTFLVPVSAIILGALVLDERLSANHFLGMAVIGLGLAAIDGRPLRAIAGRFA
jgi:drug/metabolite transporter (DMT)-like permease